MREAFSEIITAIRETLVITFVDPVREGRPQPRSWPRGLAPVGAAVLVLYVGLGLTIIFAAPLRQGDLSLGYSSQTSLPTVTLGLLLTGIIISLVLAHTAAIRGPWWLKITLFILGGNALYFITIFSVIQNLLTLFISVGMYAALLVFTLVRSRKAYAWWEFVVVGLLVGMAAFGPWLFATPQVDARVIAIEGTLGGLSVLAYPALLAAGVAPAQIVVKGAQAAASRPLRPSFFWIICVIATGWFVVQTVLSVLNGGVDLSVNALTSSLVVLVVLALVLGIWLIRAKRPAPQAPEEYPTAWEPWLLPLSAAIAGLALISLSLQLISRFVRLAGLTELYGRLDAVWRVLINANLGTIWRALLGVLLLIIAWRSSGQGKTATAAVITAFAVSAIADALGLLPGLAFLHDRTTTAMGVIAAAVALVAGAVLAIRRSLTNRHAIGILTVVLLAVLYPHRDFLDDPASFALFFSAQLLVLFGLTWRLLTGSSAARESSRRFPQSTRILLVLANTLFAVTTVAFVALSRAKATASDTAVWGANGDWILGEPLFIISLVAATWLVVRPAPAVAE